MTATDHATFLAAVCQNPADDGLRQVYADALEDAAREMTVGEMVCLACKGDPGWENEYGFTCDTCRDQLTVPDASTAARDALFARAELIRVGVELARLLDGWKPETWDCLDLYLDPQDREDQEWKHEVQRLRRRSEELLHRHAREWNPLNNMTLAFDIEGGEVRHTDGTRTRFTRGFPSHFTIPAATFLSHAGRRVEVGECPKCKGNGMLLGPHPGSSSTGPYNCPACLGTGRLHRSDSFAARLFRAAPVEEIRLHDVVSRTSPGEWFILWAPFHGSPLLQPIMSVSETTGTYWPTEAEAHRVVSEICCSWGRAEAGWPALTTGGRV